VGFFILSFYVLSYYAGIFYQAFFSVYLQWIISAEILSVARDREKDKASGINKIEKALWLICFWASLPE
jgi:hypothetical protein